MQQEQKYVIIDVLRDVIPEIEGKLHAWARWMRENARPDVPTSSTWTILHEYGITGLPHHPKGKVSPSQQEKWVAANHEILAIDKVIRQTLRKIAPLERQLFWMRYVEKKTWVEMAPILHHSESQIKRVFRERLLHAFAMEFGLLSADYARK